jgi:hypothetical protein
MNIKTLAPYIPVAALGVFFLVLYSLVVLFLFSANKNGRRRKWMPLDWLWVPLGVVTGAFLLAVWWRMH